MTANGRCRGHSKHSLLFSSLISFCVFLTSGEALYRHRWAFLSSFDAVSPPPSSFHRPHNHEQKQQASFYEQNGALHVAVHKATRCDRGSALLAAISQPTVDEAYMASSAAPPNPFKNGEIVSPEVTESILKLSTWETVTLGSEATTQLIIPLHEAAHSLQKPSAAATSIPLPLESFKVLLLADKDAAEEFLKQGIPSLTNASLADERCASILLSYAENKFKRAVLEVAKRIRRTQDMDPSWEWVSDSLSRVSSVFDSMRSVLGLHKYEHHSVGKQQIVKYPKFATLSLANRMECIAALWAYFNERLFDGELPKLSFIGVHWSELNESWNKLSEVYAFDSFELPSIRLNSRLMQYQPLMGYTLLTTMLRYYEWISPKSYAVTQEAFNQGDLTVILQGGGTLESELQRIRLIQHVDGTVGTAEEYPFTFSNGYLGDFEFTQKQTRLYGSYTASCNIGNTFAALVESGAVEAYNAAAFDHFSNFVERRALEAIWKYGRLPVREYSTALLSCGIEMAGQILASGLGRLSSLPLTQLNYAENCFIRGSLEYLQIATKLSAARSAMNKPFEMEDSPEALALQSLHLINELFTDIRKGNGYFVGDGTKGPTAETKVAAFLDVIDEDVTDVQKREAVVQQLLHLFNAYCFSNQLPTSNIEIRFTSELFGLTYFSWSFDSLAFPIIYLNSKITHLPLLAKALLEELIIVSELYSYNPINLSEIKSTDEMAYLQLFSPHRMAAKRQRIRELAEANHWPFYFEDTQSVAAFMTQEEKLACNHYRLQENAKSISLQTKPMSIEPMSNLYQLTSCGLPMERAVELLACACKRPLSQSDWTDNIVPTRSIISAFVSNLLSGVERQLNNGFRHLLQLDSKLLNYVENTLKSACALVWQFKKEEMGLNATDAKRSYIENVVLIEKHFNHIRQLKLFNSLVRDRSINEALIPGVPRSNEIISDLVLRANKENPILMEYTTICSETEIKKENRERIAGELMKFFNLYLFNGVFPVFNISWESDEMIDLSDIHINGDAIEHPIIKLHSSIKKVHLLSHVLLKEMLALLPLYETDSIQNSMLVFMGENIAPKSNGGDILSESFNENKDTETTESLEILKSISKLRSKKFGASAELGESAMQNFEEFKSYVNSQPDASNDHSTVYKTSPMELQAGSESLAVEDDAFSPQILQQRQFASMQQRIELMLERFQLPLSIESIDQSWFNELTQLEGQLLMRHAALTKIEPSSLFKDLIESNAASPDRAAALLGRSAYVFRNQTMENQIEETSPHVESEGLSRSVLPKTTTHSSHQMPLTPINYNDASKVLSGMGFDNTTNFVINFE